MTKKHFVALADALKHAKTHLTDCPDALQGWRWTVQDVANVCAQTNPRFDRARFLKACGMDGV